MADDGRLAFDIAFLDDAFQAQAERIKQQFKAIGESAVNEGRRIDQAFADLSKGYDVSTVEARMRALLSAISENESSIVSLNQKINKMAEDAKQALANEDYATFRKLREDITKTQSRIADIKAETANYKQILQEVEAAAGKITSALPTETVRFFASEDDYNRAKELNAQIDELKKKLAETADQEGINKTNGQIIELQKELDTVNKSAADAASALGDRLGSRAAKVSTRFYEINAAVKEQEQTLEALNQQLADTEDKLNKAVEANDVEEVKNLQQEYQHLSEQVRNADDALSTLKGEQKDATDEWETMSDNLSKTEGNFGRFATSIGQVSRAFTKGSSPITMFRAALMSLRGGMKLVELGSGGIKNALLSIGKAMFSLPVALVTAAIVGITALVSKLVSESKAIKEAQGEIAKSAGEAKANVDLLFNTLRNAREGTLEYKKALSQLKEQYGDIIGDLIDHEGKLTDIEEAYKRVSKAAIESARAEARRKIYVEKAGELEKEVEENIQDILEDAFTSSGDDKVEGYEHVVREAVEKYIDGEIKTADEVIKYLKANIKGLTDEDFAKRTLTIGPSRIDIKELLVDLDDIKDAKDEFDKLNKTLNLNGDAVKELDRKYGSLADRLVEADRKVYQLGNTLQDVYYDFGSVSGTGRKTRADYEAELKSERDYLSNLDTNAKDFTKERDKTLKRIRAKEKEIHKLFDDTTDERQRAAKERKKAVEENAERLYEEGKKTRDAELAYFDAVIEGWEEGVEKELAKLDQAKKRRENALADLIHSNEKELKDVAESMWGRLNPFASENGGSFNRSGFTFDASQEVNEASVRKMLNNIGITGTFADQLYGMMLEKHEQYLSQVEQDNKQAENDIQKIYKSILEENEDLNAKRLELEKEFEEGYAALVAQGAPAKVLEAYRKNHLTKTRSLYDEMLGDYKTYEQRRNDIAIKYAKDRDNLYKKDANGNRIGVSQENVERLNQKEREEFVSLLDSQLQEYENSLQGMEDATKMALQRMLVESNKLLGSLLQKKMKGVILSEEEEQQLQALMVYIPQLEQEIKELDAQKLQNIGRKVADLGSKFTELGRTIGGTIGNVMSFVGETVTGVGNAFEGLGRIEEMAADGALNAAEKLEKASIILTVITTAIKFIKSITDLINGEDEGLEKLEEATKNYENIVHDLTRAYDKLSDAIDKAYSSDKAALIQKQINLLKQEIEANKDNNAAIRERYNELLNRYNRWSEMDAIDKAVNNFLHTSASWTDEEQAELEELEAQLRESGENIEDLQRQIEELRQAAVDAIFGSDIQSAIERFADALTDAWEQGKDASESAKDFINSMIKDMFKQALLSAIANSNMMDDLRSMLQTWIKTLDFGISSASSMMQRNLLQRMESTITTGLSEYVPTLEDILSFGNTMADSLSGIGEIYRNFITETEGDREAQAKGIAQASQESVDELNGRMTAVQGHTFNISENSNIIRDNIAAINGNVALIRDYTSNLVQMRSDMGEMKNDIQQIRLHGVQIQSA